VRFLRDQELIGDYQGCVAFPVHNSQGGVIGCHYRWQRGDKCGWLYEPEGNKIQPLIVGDLASAREVWAFESQWDGLAVMGCMGWHDPDASLDDVAVVITRGAKNGALVRGRLPSGCRVFVWPQNDDPKPNGDIPSEKWFNDLTSAVGSGSKVFRVETPACFKDPNQWIQDMNLGREVIQAAIDAAKEVHATINSTTPVQADERDESDLPESLRNLVPIYGQPVFGEGRTFRLNEAFWAAAYAQEAGVMWEPGERSFYQYQPATGLWASLSPEAAQQGVSAFLMRYSQVPSLQGIQQKRGIAVLQAIVAQLRGIAEKRSPFSNRRDLIHVANCMVQLAGGVDQLPFAAEHYSRNGLPVKYDPGATCPRFLNELLLPAVNEEDATLIQRWFGSAIVQRNLPQRLLILDGDPGRGKSQLAALAQVLVGEQNCGQLRTHLLAERFELGRLLSKTLLIGPDVRGDFLMEDSAHVIKALIGGDPMEAEKKGSNGSFTLRGTFNVLLTCNERLRVRLSGDVGAWERRLLIVRFEAPPPAKKIPDFGLCLFREEGAGILNWAIAGAQHLLRDIEETGDYVLSEAQQSRISNLLAESSSVEQFVVQCIEDAPTCSISNTEVIESYYRFCVDREWSPLSRRSAERQIPEIILRHHGVSCSHDLRRDGKSARGYRNLRLAS
jgi:hypothetical protein